MDNIQKGRQGEDLAVAFLQRQDFKILARNFRTRLGEIDIIAREKQTICFIEVKKRNTSRRGEALEAVTLSKQKKIVKISLIYLKMNNMLGKPVRFDVVAIDRNPKGEDQCKMIKNAFEVSAPYNY